MRRRRMAARRGNKNARGKRARRDRIPVNLSISERNGLLDLFEQYLSRQGIETSDEAIKQLAADWAYFYWGERLKREIEMSEEAIIL
jgi:hypothetical protein